jgi:Ca2+-binding RTX toxin-like protein
VTDIAVYRPSEGNWLLQTNRGGGNDIMNGGAGNDIFVFTPGGFGNDSIVDFDADATNGQDLLDISALGIPAATFPASVSITVLGVSATNPVADTLVTIGADSIFLDGVTGVGANSITQADFLLA